MSTLGRRWPRRFQVRVGLPLTVDSAADSAEVNQAQKPSAQATRAGEASPAPTSIIVNLLVRKGPRNPLRFYLARFLALGLRRDQCVAARLRLLVFHSAPACDMVPLVDMNFWKLRFASAHGNGRAIAFGWKTRNAGPGANHRSGCEFYDVSRKPNGSGPRANWTREAGGDASPYDAFGRSSTRHEVINAMVYARYWHKLSIGNVNVTYNSCV